MIKTDVCVIGAGPSGASTSLMLSKLKIHHHIIDKATFPRDKICGDGLILYAYKSMKMLGLLDDFLKHPEFIHSKTINLHLYNDLKLQISESEERDMVISYGKRIHFDYFLVNNLSKKYATCNFGNGVKKLVKTPEGILITLRDDQQILSKIVVGADGMQSIVSKKMAYNLPDKKKSSTFISAYFKNVQNLIKNNEAEIRIVYNKTPLFFYLFPLTNNEANVTLGGNTEQLLKNNINLKEEVITIINSHPKVSHKFKEAEQIHKWRGWGIPYSFKDQKVCGERFFLVGDAAGLTNAFYKEGVGTGMMSGILCAEKIANCLKQNNYSEDFIQDYKETLSKEFSKLLNFSEFALKASYYKKLFYFSAKFMKAFLETRFKSIILKRSY